MLYKNGDSSQKGMQSTEERLPLVCVFNYGERPLMSMEEKKKRLKEGNDVQHNYEASSYSVLTSCTGGEHSQLKQKCDEHLSPCLYITTPFDLLTHCDLAH